MKTPGLIDLHLHLDGSLSVKSVKELAALQNIEIPEKEEELLKLLRVNDDCKDLTEYLEKFAFPGKLLQTKEGLALSVYNLQEELKEQGLIHAEIRFAPQLHTLEGLSQREVIEAAIDGLDRSDFSAELILCCMRGNDNHEANLETVKLAKDYLGKGVCAVDIAGAEALFPTENFGDLFALARELEIPYTIHAGEADGPKSVWKALEYGTKRLGHGVRSLEDPALIEKIASEGITLELCPTSNLHTCMFPCIEEYPLRKLMEAGVRVTINTDNMTVSNVTLGSEFRKLIAAFDLTDEEIKDIARNSVRASFASEETKKILLEKIEKAE
ncbi:MAG: adenosine deaminase [Oscillospiraceae bacterium]|nr:adenosine deaminase [Oscillospiraceae bacterium]MBQ4643579.1 adenosine deaminase [Oscillospiraceae bacterium]